MKELYKNPDTQKKMNDGIQKVAEIVQCTLGPYGRNVAIMDTRQENSLPLLTDDGVRVVEFALSTLTGLELLGARLVYTSSKKTEEDVGDGTTSTYLIAANVIDKYLKLIEDRRTPLNPVLVRKGITKAKDHILEYLKTVQQRDISEEILTNIAVSSSGSLEIGKTVGELRHRLGPDGLVNIRSSKNNTDAINYANGYEFTGGFVNQELFSSKPVDCYDPFILVIDKMIMTMEDAAAILNAYNMLIKNNQLTYDTPMVVLCNKFDGEALKTIYHNWFLRTDKISVPIIPVEVPITTDHFGTFEDLSIITGAKVISAQSSALDKSELVASAGRATNVKTSKKITYIVAKDDDTSKARIAAHVEDLKAQRDKLTDQASGGEYANLMVRISKLNGIAVTIEVGAATEIERTERKLKYDDAVLATHAASKEGVVIGGGYSYFKAYYWIKEKYAKEIEDLKSQRHSEYVGFSLMLDALRLPFELIPKNSGLLEYDYWHKIKDYQSAAWEELEKIILYIDLDNMNLQVLQKEECKVYDPYLVAKAVIENAVSAISLFVSTENSVLVEMR